MEFQFIFGSPMSYAEVSYQVSNATAHMLNTRAIQCPQYLLDQAKARPAAPTAIVNAGTRLALQGARLAFDEGLIEPVLVGDLQAISWCAHDIGWDISEIRMVAAESEQQAAQTAVLLANNNEVCALVKGSVHTDILLQAVTCKHTGLRTKRGLSHVFHMSMPESDKVLYISDAVIRVSPSVKVKMDIVRNAVELAHTLGNSKPKVAILSATEQATPAMPSSEDAVKITRLAEKGGVKEAIVYGPLAFDLAVSSEAARIKGIDNPVAGNADILVVPNIETGNALFKQMVYFMGACAAGIVLGAKVPIALTSRADSAAARLASTAIAAIIAVGDQPHSV